MYVSIRDDIVLALDYQDISQGLQELGLDAVELAVDRDYNVRPIQPSAGGPPRLNAPDGIQKLAEQRDRARVRIPALLLATDFNSPKLDTEIRWVVQVTEAAQRLGVTVIRLDPIMRGERELPIERRIELLAGGIRRVIEQTEGSGVAYGVENHGLQGNDPVFMEALFAAVGSPRVGMTLDTGNFYWAGHPLSRVYEIIERLAPRAVHTHVKNIRYPEPIRETQRELGYGYEQYVSPIPEGDIDHERVVGILRKAGYQGDLCIEDESLGHYDRAGRRANVRAAADQLRALAG